MGHRDDRDRHARQPADLRREHPAGIDDDVGRDRLAPAAVLDLDAGHPSAIRDDRNDPGVGPDLRAALPGARGQGLGQAGRIEPAVGREPDGPEDAVGRHEREAVARLRGRNQLQRQPERPRPADLALELLEAGLGRRQPERPDLVPRGIDAGLVAKAPVQVGAVHHHLGQGHGAAQLANEAGRVERRARGQLGPVDQDDVAPAKLGEVVGDRRPADAAPDDHRPGVLNHGASLSGCRVPPSALAANRQWQAALPESRKSPAVGMNSHS